MTFKSGVVIALAALSTMPAVAWGQATKMDASGRTSVQPPALQDEQGRTSVQSAALQDGQGRTSVQPPALQDEQGRTSVQEQQISDFTLAGYGAGGRKDWEVTGKTADIGAASVKLDKVTGNLYDAEEEVKLSADKGALDKESGQVNLRDNVVITTSSGAKLTTDSLQWDRKNQIVSTDDVVNLQKDNVTMQAEGAQGQPGLKTVQLKKDVKVDIQPEPEQHQAEGGIKEKILITCDGPVEINYSQNIATLRNNVKVERLDSVIYSDSMDVFFYKAAQSDTSVRAPDPEGSAQVSSSAGNVYLRPRSTSVIDAAKSTGLFGSKIEKIVARGNVRVVRGENVSYSEEATYLAADNSIHLSGRPKLVFESMEELNDASSGNARPQ